MNPRYLVAWSGGRHSSDVLVLAAVLARSFDASLDVVYVQRVEQGITAAHPGERGFEQVVLTQAKEAMARAVQQLGTGLEITLHSLPSPSIAEGLLEAARRFNSSMVVIGADHGWTLPLASTIPAAVLRDSPVPVALVPHHHGFSPRCQLSEVVLCVGARAGAEIAIQETLEAVQRAHVPLKIVSLVELDGRDRKIPEPVKESTSRTLEDAEKKAQETAGVTTVVAQGSSLSEVIDQIDWRPDSVAVVGAARLAPGRQALLGALAARAQARFPVPMIVVPAGPR